MLVVGSVSPGLSAVEVLKMESEVLKMESELDTSKKGKDSFWHLLQHQGSSERCSSAYSSDDRPMHLAWSQ